MPKAFTHNDIPLHGVIPYAGYRDTLWRGEFYYKVNEDAVDTGVYNIPLKIWQGWVESKRVLLIEENKEDRMSNLPAVKQEQSHDVFAIMDKLDDEIIQAELENRVVSTWVYSFDQDGKPQTGLSKKGVDEACTEMAKKGHIIEEESVEYSPCPISKEHVLFKARVRRILVNPDGSRVPMETVFGTKRQWIKDTRKGGAVVEDKFWYEKGAAKALRNARSRLIPAEIQAAIISLAKQKGKVQQIPNQAANPISQPQRQAPPPPAAEGKPAEINPKQKKLVFAKSMAAFNSDKETTLKFIKWNLETEGAEYWTKDLLDSFIDDFENRVALYKEEYGIVTTDPADIQM